MEEYLGRKLADNEIVHHINGNKKDNRIENLQVMDKLEHIKMHYKRGDYKNCLKDEKRVEQLDLEGNVLQIFNSIREAGRALGDVRKNGHIADVCKGKRKVAWGYKWRYVA